MVKRRSGGDSSSGGMKSSSWPMESDSKKYPTLCEWLSAISYEDGGKRVPPSMTFFVDEGSLKVCLSDRDQGLVGFLTFTDLVGLWKALEERIAADDIDWRKARPRPSSGSPKRS